jgi:hypothetical protein
VDAVTGEAPDDDQAGDALDCAVDTPADQGDRAGGEPCKDADDGLRGHPSEAEPGDQLHAAHERRVRRSLEWKLQAIHQYILILQVVVDVNSEW